MNTSESESSRREPSALQVEQGAESKSHLKAMWLVLLALVMAGSVTLVAWLSRSSPTPISILLSSPTPELQGTSATVRPLTWSPDSIEVILVPGESASRSVSFASSRTLKNVTLEVVPAIAPFLSISPDELSQIPANTPQTIQVDFAIPNGTSLGSYDGTIHIRLGSQTLPQTLKISLTVLPATAEETLSYLADQIASGNLDEALKLMSPSQLNRAALEALDSTARLELADRLENAQLVREVDNVRIYRTSTNSRFSLMQTGEGYWVVINW